MIVDGSKLWIYSSELTQQFGIKFKTIKDGLYRNRKGIVPTWKHKAHDQDKRVKLIDYDSLPDTTKAKLPSRADLVKSAQADQTESKLTALQDACEKMNELHSRFCLVSDYQYFLQKISDRRKAEDLKQAAGWL